MFWMEALGGGFSPHTPVFDGLSIAVDPGQVVIVKGENGSGKTSVLLALLGLLPCVWGKAGYKNKVLRGPVWGRVRAAGMGVAMQRLKLFPTLTLRENLEFACGRREGMAVLNRYEMFRPIRRLAAERRPANTLSSGEQGLVSLACAVGGMSQGGMLCLDEPLANIHRDLHGEFRTILAELNDDGAIALICEHHGGPVDGLIHADHMIELSPQNQDHVANQRQEK